MANSPYLKTINPPIQDLDYYSALVREYRAELDRGENNKYAQTELTDMAEHLLEHCDFLIEKLSIKSGNLKKLQSENSDLKKRIEALEATNKAQNKNANIKHQIHIVKGDQGEEQ